MYRESVLVVHGGAGTIHPSAMTPDKEAAYIAALSDALKAGQTILENGGAGVDAVVACVRSMEECPLFNAGRGSVFTNDGRNELDASIMDGRTRAAGAVAGVSRIRNPIVAAHAIMRHSGHVMLIGAGAEAFAQSQGLEMVEPSFFRTEERWSQLEQARGKEIVQLDHDSTSNVVITETGADPDEKYGTVGAVALDRFGNLAAGTSTGGMTNKKWGRVGDSPIVGAGTYADNASAAVSCTGMGEIFLRCVAAYEVTALMKYRKASLKTAVEEVALRIVPELGGKGGLIAVDPDGNVAMAFSTEGMYRGLVRGRGAPEIAIYSEL